MVIDFHTHILPVLDDGSTSVEMSVEMLRKESEQGIRHVLATPHFYPHRLSPEQFLEKRRESERRLREEMAKYANLPQVTVGAEVYFFSGISDSELINELTIDGTRSILIELPVSPWPDRVYKELEDIWVKHGITPVIAHIDRYISPFKTYQIPERLAELPVVVQANASFFIRRTTRIMAMRLLKENKIHLLGSDCHNLSTREPNLGAAVQLITQRLGNTVIDQICANEHELFDQH